MFIGHNKIRSFFKKAIANKAMAQVYCLAGQSQVGKRAIAKWIASELLGVSVDKLAQHPDFYYLERASDPETGKLKKELSVAQARELKARFHQQHQSQRIQATASQKAKHRAANETQQPVRATILFIRMVVLLSNGWNVGVILTRTFQPFNAKV